MRRRLSLLTLLVMFSLCVSPVLKAQGPGIAYLMDPDTDLSWAECYVYLDGGSRHKIPFLPLVNSHNAPSGTERYTKDVRINGPIAFAGNGIVLKDRFDCYRGLDVSGKIVMFSYDFPDSAHVDIEKEVSLPDRIREAVARKASGIVLFSWEQEFPFLMENLEGIPDIPIIVINRQSARVIIASATPAPIDQLLETWKSKGLFWPQILISKLNLSIDGKFDTTSTDHFQLFFQKGKLPSARISQLVDVNEKAAKFLLNLFKDEKLAWQKMPTVYFRDYDSKLFYTHHWGTGLSSDDGNFMVFGGSIPDFGLAVHENAHFLIGKNWGGTTSFMNEGIGRYAEAMATDKDLNNDQTIGFLKDSKLFPLEKMIGMDIGSMPGTDIAYAASGSFIQYLTETYSLHKLKEAYQLENRPQPEKGKQSTWSRVFGKKIEKLEEDWLHWLAARRNTDRKFVEDYLGKRKA